MPIPVGTIIEQCEILLDAEDSDRYTFDEDYKLAINNTQRWLVNLFHKIYGVSKYSEEALQELVKVGVFKASNYSRVSITNDPDDPTIFWQEDIDNAAAVNATNGVRIPITGQKFVRGDVVFISGTTNYDGVWEIVSSITNYIVIDATFVAETFAGTETVKLTHNVWSILGVYPEITTIPESPSIPVDSDKSYFCGALAGTTDEVAVNELLKPATRLNIEEWSERKQNPLVPGSELITNTELVEYAYLPLMNYNPDRAYSSVWGINLEIEISPPRSNEMVGIIYLIIPDSINLESDTVPFPMSIFDLFVNKVLNFISMKEDDRFNLYEITEKEIAEVINFLS